MSSQMPLERMVTTWMADEAVGAPMALLEDILGTTSTIKPTARWRAVLAEPALRHGSKRAAVGLPNRGLLYVAIVALILAAAALVVVGARLLLEPNPPPAVADWAGFRGNADRGGVGVEGPSGYPVQRWRYEAQGGVPEVVVAGESAFFASDDGFVHAVTVDGGVDRWSAALGPEPLVGPYAADGRLYLADGNGVVHALAQSDGTRVWTSASGYATPSRMVSAGGEVYFGTADGQVVALDASTGAERWRVHPPGATTVGAPAVDGGRLFIGTGTSFVAIDLGTHEVAWTGDTNGELTGTATAGDGRAFMGVGSEASAGALRAFDEHDGTLRWTAPDQLLSLPTVADSIAYSSTINGRLDALDVSTGALRWSVDFGGEIRSPVVANGAVYVLAGAAKEVVSLDAATGLERWRFPIDAYANCCISVAKGAVFVGTLGGSVYAIGGDGRAVTALPFPSAPATAATPSSAAPTAAPPSEAPLAQLDAKVTLSVPLPPDGVNPICQIALAPDGRLWVPLGASGTFAIYEPDGTLAETWGSPGTGEGEFDLVRPDGSGYGTLAFAPDGSFYVLDAGNRRVQHFDKHRTYLGEWGGFGQGPRQYSDPVGLVVAADGTLWVLDDRRPALEHYAPDGTVLATLDPYTAEPVNDGSNSLAIDPAGNLYVTLFEPAEVLVFDPEGQYLRTVGKGVFSASEQPTDMAIDAAGHLFVDQGPQRGSAPGVLVFGPDGAPLGGFGPVGTGDGELLFPAGIAFDTTGALWVMDSLPESARLIRYQLPGELSPP